ncbi:DNA replication/repair protein RecF [Thermoanaerobacteraceae bacterium SP2]|nr:DNA replication/repair protein RecF [Thermoanaerobacteraceae bacterium SP2]
MYLSHLRLFDFRNFKELDVSFSPGINILYGDNAQGKTNLLESIFFLSNLRSERAVRDQQLIMYTRPLAFLRGVFETCAGPVEREVTVYSDKKKVVKEGGNQKNRWSEICEDISAVFFSPDDLNLIKGEPSLRRKFLDTVIYHIKPGYIKYLQVYYRVLAHRNTLLKAVKKNPSLSDNIDPWDLQLCDTGSRIFTERLKFLERIGPDILEIFKKFTGGNTDFKINYINSVNFMSRDSIRQDFLKTLKGSREKDIARSFTTCGPHRDDIQFLLDGHDARFFGSQGQQRMLVLCLKMAQAKILFRERGEPPIMLLDDVMSELDLTRRKLIVENHGSQVFITTTDLKFIPDEILAKSKLYQVRAGSLE